MTGSTTACWKPCPGRAARGTGGAGQGCVRAVEPAAVRDRRHALSPAGRRVLAGPRPCPSRRLPLRRHPQDHSRAGSTSSPRRSGTCAPRGPRWSTWSGPPRPPAPGRRSGRCATCCAACTRPAGGRGAPLVVLDAGYSAAALTAALAGCPVHLLIRLAGGSVFYADPVTWPGKRGRPGKHGMPVTCHNGPGQANPEPDESLIAAGHPAVRHRPRRRLATRPPLIHGDRGYFAGWPGELPVLRGTVLRVTVSTCPTAGPRQGHVAVARRPRPAVTRRAVARLPGPFR